MATTIGYYLTKEKLVRSKLGQLFALSDISLRLAKSNNKSFTKELFNVIACMATEITGIAGWEECVDIDEREEIKQYLSEIIHKALDEKSASS